MLRSQPLQAGCMVRMCRFFNRMSAVHRQSSVFTGILSLSLEQMMMWQQHINANTSTITTTLLLMVKELRRRPMQEELPQRFSPAPEEAAEESALDLSVAQQRASENPEDEKELCKPWGSTRGGWHRAVRRTVAGKLISCKPFFLVFKCSF